MNLFKIAWRSIQHRGFGSLLNILSMALGVMLLVTVLSVYSALSKSFKSNSSFGYNIIVGPKGGDTQLTLNTVFYLSKPTGTIPYEYFLEFCDQKKREEQFDQSISRHHLASVDQALHLAAEGAIDSGEPRLNCGLLNQLHKLQWDQRANLSGGRSTAAGRNTGMAIPLCLGDYWGYENAYFRVVGTTPDIFHQLELDIDTGEKLELAEGRAFVHDHPKHRYFECVMGSAAAKVARAHGVNIGDSIYPIHGDPNETGAHVHAQGFVIVGMLKPTGTAHDRAVYINIEGFYLMEDHANVIDEDSISRPQEPPPLDDFFSGSSQPIQHELASTYMADSSRRFEQVAALMTAKRPIELENPSPESGEFELKVAPIPLPIEQREVSAILIRTKDDDFGQAAGFLTNKVNDNNLTATLDWSDFRPPRDVINDAASAVNPVAEVYKIFAVFIDPIRWVLLGLTTLICVVSGISILVGIYNSMAQRRHEIAVMRALGASREKVTGILLIETAILAIIGGFIGWLGGHVLMWSLGGMMENYAGIRVGLFEIAPIEFWLIPALLLLSLFIGIYPAISAYRMDISKNLD